MTGWLAVLGHGVAWLAQFCSTPLGHVVLWIVGIVTYALIIRGNYRQNGIPQATFAAIGFPYGGALLYLLPPYLVAHYRLPYWLGFTTALAAYIVGLYILGKFLTSRLVTRMCGGGGGA